MSTPSLHAVEITPDNVVTALAEAYASCETGRVFDGEVVAELFLD